MAGVRKTDPPQPESVKLSVLIPAALDNRLRRYAVRSKIKIGPLVRGWIEAQLEQVEKKEPPQ